MKYHLYNSFTLGPGYQHLDLIDDKLVDGKDNLNMIIKSDFDNGGAKMVLRLTEEGLAYLLVKKLEYDRSDKEVDEQGRKVFMNFAIEGDKKDYNFLSRLFVAFIMEWENAKHYLADLLETPYENAYDYHISQPKMENFLNKIANVAESCPFGNLKKLLHNTEGKSAVSIVYETVGGKEYYEKLRNTLYKISGMGVPPILNYNITILLERFNEIKARPYTADYAEFKKMIDDSILSKEGTDNDTGIAKVPSENEIEHNLSDTEDDTVREITANKEYEEISLEGSSVKRIEKPWLYYATTFIAGSLIGFLIARYIYAN